MPNQYTLIGAIISGLIILGGLYAIIRNFAIFLFHITIRQRTKPFYNQPYLFRTLAWIFTLFWLYGPYSSLHFSQEGEKWLAFTFYMLAAVNWLWVARVSFLDGIPQQEFQLGPSWAHVIGWQGHATITYLIQVMCAAGLGFIFISVELSSILRWALVVLLFLISIILSTWRISIQTGHDHTLSERLQHALGGREAGPPHTSAET
jgi:hypothetical protein